MDMFEKTDTASSNLEHKENTNVKIGVFLSLFWSKNMEYLQN